MFAAELKLSSKISRKEKYEIITRIIKLLNLQKCENINVHHLSGGEKKRLSIGVELITNPSVMFFDEPTSGLDSVSSLQVIKHLRNLAHEGRTVIVVVHQPSSSLLQLFDDLYVLTNGNCIYNGPLDQMVDVFKQAGLNCPNYYNRADFALEVASVGMVQGDNESIEEDSMNDLMVNGLEKLISINKEKAMQVEEYGNFEIADENLSVEQKLLLSNVTPSQSSNESSLISGYNGEYEQKYETSLGKQITVLTKRSMLCTIRDLVSDFC